MAITDGQSSVSSPVSSLTHRLTFRIVCTKDRAMYKKLSSKVVFQHPRIALVEDQIELPGGQKADYLWMKDRADAVTVIARDKKGNILVEQEYSYLPNRILNQLPGGGVN